MITAPCIQQFTVRKQRHRKMIQTQTYPASTASKFIVPCFERSLGFKSNQYAKHAQLLQDYIQKQNFQAFVKNANRIIEKQLLQKAKNQNSTFFPKTSMYLKLSIILGILTFTILSLIVYMDFQQTQQDIILKVSLVLIFFSVGIGSVSPFYLFTRKYHENDYEANIKKQLDQLADKQNTKNRLEGKQYLTWSFEKQFFWIELDINHQLYREKMLKIPRKYGNQSPPVFQTQGI